MEFYLDNDYLEAHNNLIIAVIKRKDLSEGPYA